MGGKESEGNSWPIGRKAAELQEGWNQKLEILRFLSLPAAYTSLQTSLYLSPHLSLYLCYLILSPQLSLFLNKNPSHTKLSNSHVLCSAT